MRTELVSRIRKAGGGAPGPGGTDVLSGQSVVSVPAYSAEHQQTVAAAGVTGAMRVFPVLAPHVDEDANHESMLDIATLTASAGGGQITFSLSFAELAAGEVRINWMAV